MSRVTHALDDAPELEPGSRATGMVVTSHPRAVEAGVAALAAGGNAVDAAVTAAAVLGVVDPMSSGIGGDCFALVWNGALHGINGSGAAPRRASPRKLVELGHRAMPERGPVSVTVPGALDAWARLVERFGARSLGHALEPAIAIARDGFEVTPVVARDWEAARPLLRTGRGTDVYLAHGAAPLVGERFAQPALAATMQRIAMRGIAELYGGELGARICAALDGWMEPHDLAAHSGEWVEPLAAMYRGHPVYELPPNGQGIVVLEALSLLDQYPLGDLSEVERAHLSIEALKLAFADARAHVGDPSRSDVQHLLDPEHLERRLEQLDARRAHVAGVPLGGSDTVYVATRDASGMACSLISSLYMHFGAGIVVDGVCLQNRGALFSLDEAHPSALGPGRRPYHTIIPAMAFRADRPFLIFGVVGGFQQPQAQVQLLTRLIDEGRSIRDAIEAPRFRWLEGNRIRLEDNGTARHVGLERLGHEVVDDGSHGGFGGAQAILVDDEGLVHGASDSRKDGVVGLA